MSASRVWAASIFTAALLVASPALAVIDITSDEIWDGNLNPRAADGVTLTITGDYATNNRVATYNIPTGITLGAGANIFLHDLANPQFSSAINFNFAPGAGAFTFTDATSTIDVTKGGRNNPAKLHDEHER